MTKLETKLGTIVIRQAESSDAASIITYMNWAPGEVDYHTFGADDFIVTLEDEEKIIESFAARDNCMFLLAHHNEEIVAIATLAGGIKDRVCHRATIGITVAKKYWRLGIGKKMMKMIIAYARLSPVLTKLELLVHEKNEPALTLYHELGFFQEGSICRYFHIDNTYYDGIYMGKLVD